MFDGTFWFNIFKDTLLPPDPCAWFFLQVMFDGTHTFLVQVMELLRVDFHDRGRERQKEHDAFQVPWASPGQGLSPAFFFLFLL